MQLASIRMEVVLLGSAQPCLTYLADTPGGGSLEEAWSGSTEAVDVVDNDEEVFDEVHKMLWLD